MEAMGIFYLHLVKHDSLLRNLTLATFIIPISFMANVIRVIVLVLITYYYGDSAAQGFIHEFAGVLLFVVGLSMTIMVDASLQALARWRAGSSREDRLA
jgi:exosortase/archaeosortase family protein